MTQLKHQIVILPTEKAVFAGLMLSKHTNFLLRVPHKSWDGQSLSDLKMYIPQHLYILNNEEIRKNDWYIDINKNRLYQCEEDSNEDMLSFINSKCKKVIASTDKSLDLPNLSEGFINKFIKMYNLGTPITNVIVEYEERFANNDLVDTTTRYFLKVHPDNTIICSSVEVKTYTEEEVINYLREIAYHVNSKGYGGHSVVAPFVRNWWKNNK